MKNLLLTFTILILSFKLEAQFQIGLTGGVTLVDYEEAGMFKPSINANANAYYITPINFMLGLHISYLDKMNLSDKWATDKFSQDIIGYNTAYLRHYPFFTFSINYVLSNTDKTFMYAGIGLGKIKSSTHGGVEVTNEAGSSNELVFYGEEHSAFSISPRLGFTRPLFEDIRLQGELTYHIVKSEFKSNLFSVNLGLLFPIKFSVGKEL